MKNFFPPTMITRMLDKRLINYEVLDPDDKKGYVFRVDPNDAEDVREIFDKIGLQYDENERIERVSFMTTGNITNDVKIEGKNEEIIDTIDLLINVIEFGIELTSSDASNSKLTVKQLEELKRKLEDGEELSNRDMAMLSSAIDWSNQNTY